MAARSPSRRGACPSLGRWSRHRPRSGPAPGDAIASRSIHSNERRRSLMKRSPMTAKGAERLRAELERLKSQDRPRVIAAIAEARAHGDLRENAEYHAAREQQGFIEGRIKELEGTPSNAQLIDVTSLNAGSRVVFGANVELADVETDERRGYQIV